MPNGMMGRVAQLPGTTEAERGLRLHIEGPKQTEVQVVDRYQFRLPVMCSRCRAGRIIVWVFPAYRCV